MCARPENKDFIYLDEAKQLLRATHYTLSGARIRFSLPRGAAVECWYKKEHGVGQIMVRKDYIAVSMEAQGLSAFVGFSMPEHNSTII